MTLLAVLSGWLLTTMTEWLNGTAMGWIIFGIACALVLIGAYKYHTSTKRRK